MYTRIGPPPVAFDVESRAPSEGPHVAVCDPPAVTAVPGFMLCGGVARASVLGVGQHKLFVAKLQKIWT